MDRNGRDARLALLAGRQAGVFSLEQALQLGFPRSTIGDRARRGVWERRLPSVFAVGGSPISWEARLWAASLGVGPSGSLSHETAALCHGAERLATDPVVLTCPHRWHHRLPGVFVHQIDDLQPWHLTTWRGLPISRPSRTVVELAATQSTAVIGRVADDLVRLRATSYGEIGRVFFEVARPGKPGMARLARVMDERTDGHVPPSSELERALFDALAAGGLPPPRRQVPLPGRSVNPGIADAAYDDARIVLEVDGRRWHSRVDAARRDRERDVQVVRAGWVPMRFVYEQVVGSPAEVCAAVWETRSVRLALLQRAA
jgi:very-short-patch-repair endonuclease